MSSLVGLVPLDVNAATRICELHRLLEIHQPEDALFLIDRNALGVHCVLAALLTRPFRALVTLNFLRVQNLTAVSPCGWPEVGSPSWNA